MSAQRRTPSVVVLDANVLVVGIVGVRKGVRTIRPARPQAPLILADQLVFLKDRALLELRDGENAQCLRLWPLHAASDNHRNADPVAIE